MKMRHFIDGGVDDHHLCAINEDDKEIVISYQ
jgi:hypothetical protein